MGSTTESLAAEVVGFGTAVAVIEEDMDPNCDRLEYAAENGQLEGLGGVTYMACRMKRGAIITRTHTLAYSLREMSPYPSEVDGLVEDTITKADHLAAADVDEACSDDPTSELCHLANLNFKLHKPGMDELVAKWGAYSK